ncbi:MAG: alpha-L-rhamnosidase N-terminal domain-containing protein, partial [Microbacterium sp.]|uniref:glycoside hydrolase family 78 protein n=2 Tax=unclassified Microbacterium TaxID=2609290 RepID=UPI001AC1ED4D
MSVAEVALRADLREDTPFVATAHPRLSWRVRTETPDWHQSSAELTDGTDTIALEGDASVLVDWPFRPLAPGEEREVRVRVTDAAGTTSPWSVPLPVAAGFLGADEWVAAPVGLADATAEAQPALVRTSFRLERPVRRALLFWTALGAAEPEINGTPVSDDVLSPGWTSYRDRLVHETVDVTTLLA